jgi:hypothetical protein
MRGPDGNLQALVQPRFILKGPAAMDERESHAEIPVTPAQPREWVLLLLLWIHFEGSRETKYLVDIFLLKQKGERG